MCIIKKRNISKNRIKSIIIKKHENKMVICSFFQQQKNNKNDQLGEICFDIPFPEGKALFL